MYKRQPVVIHQEALESDSESRLVLTTKADSYVVDSSNINWNHDSNAAIVVSDRFLSQVSAVISNPTNKHRPILTPRINNRISSRLMICLK